MGINIKVRERQKQKERELLNLKGKKFLFFPDALSVRHLKPIGVEG